MQVLKQIWNERRPNGWLWAELLIVFVVLWYVVDWTYTKARCYYEPVGFDITDTYYVELGLRNSHNGSFIPEGKLTTSGEDVLELANRLRRLPEVEAVSVSCCARPYQRSSWGMELKIDTLSQNSLLRRVTPDFFRVFRYQSVDGRGEQPLVQAIANGNMVIGENFWPSDYAGDRTLLGKEAVLLPDHGTCKIGAVSAKVRFNDFWSIFDNRYCAIPYSEKEIAKVDVDFRSFLELCLRVKPGTPKDFSEFLMKQSERNLNVGNLFVMKVHDYENIRADVNRENYKEVQMRLWMMAFLLLNILLGIVGTFWFRTQHRRAELALRIVVGSTRSRLWWWLNKEGWILLSLAALAALPVCFHIIYFDLTAGSWMEGGVFRFLVTFGITYLLMLLMIIIGIWFPARQAIHIQPAEALRQE